MHESTKMKVMLWFTILYMFFFTVVALLNNNYEFLYYTLVMSIIILILIIYREKIALSAGIAFGLTVVAALHIFGGNVHIFGVRLYDVWLFNGFRFDNFVHIIGSFVAALLSYTFVYQHLNDKARDNKLLLAIIIISMASGIGALNEILELGAVIWFNASLQVGNYFNNALDLLYNLIGAILACIYLFYIHREKK